MFFVQIVVVLRYPCFTPAMLLLGAIEHWARYIMGKFKPLGSAKNRPPPGAKLTFFFLVASPVAFLISILFDESFEKLSVESTTVP